MNYTLTQFIYFILTYNLRGADVNLEVVIIAGWLTIGFCGNAAAVFALALFYKVNN